MDQALGYPTGILRTNFLLLGKQPVADGFPNDVSFRSVAVVRNIDSVPVQVTPTVRYQQSGSAQSITLGSLSLNPNESKLIDFSEEQARGHLPPALAQATLQLTPSTNHNSLAAEMFNFDQSSHAYNVGSSFLTYPAKGTGSIWRTDGSFQTTIIAENTTTQDDHVVMKLFSDVDSYSKTFPISAGATLKINVQQLQHDGTPDDSGHLLRGVSGTLLLAGSSGIHSKLAFDKLIHSANAAEYVGELNNPCDYALGASLFLEGTNDPSEFDVFLDIQFSISGDVEQSAFSTSSSDSSRVKIVGTAEGDVAVVLPGSKSENVTIASPPLDETVCDACSAGNIDPEPTGINAPASPTFTINPPSGSVGNVPVTLSNLSSGSFPIGITSANISINPPDFTVASAANGAGNTVNATFAITSSTSLGAHTVTVSTSGEFTNSSIGTFTVVPPPPQINSFSPSRGLIDATTSKVTFVGSGLSGAHINTPAAIQVSNETVNTDSEIQVDFIVSSTANPGKNLISVSTADGQSNQVNFFVQVPTSLSIVPGSATGTEKMCTSNACGTIVSFIYQVNDQDSPPQPIAAKMAVWDSFGSYSPDGLHLQNVPVTTTCSPANTGPCGVFTSLNGRFTEGALGACATVCFVNGACTTGGPSDVPQTWHVASSSIVQQVSEYCQQVLVNGVKPQ